MSVRRELLTFIKEFLPNKIVLLSGPRQSGKTTLSKALGLGFDYLNYDSIQDRKLLLSKQWDRKKELIIFDEIHKMKGWKSWIKGIYDTEGISPQLLITGSARLDTFRKAGDSLAGRHVKARLYPFTLRELSGQIDAQETWTRFLTQSNFPEPFSKNDSRFSKIWRSNHLDVILREDLRDLELVRDIKLIEVLVELLRSRVGSTIPHETLGKELQVSGHTIKKWLQYLENLYVIFPVRPYVKNVPRSILKDSKYYFFDTGAVLGDPGAILENAVAVHLLRELHFYEDNQGGKGELYFLKNKQQNEIDFLTVVDRRPRQMIEVKLSDTAFSSSFQIFKKYFKKIEMIQLVQELDRNRTTPEMTMCDPVSFLSTLKY